MKYEFHVGDYVEDITGRIGYVNSICHCKYCKERGFYEPHIMYNNGDTDYITAYEYDKGFLDYKRIGQYDFTKKDKVEPLLINKHINMYCGNGKTNSPSDYKTAFEQDELNDKMIDKINELVEAVNRLEEKVNEMV